MSVLDNLTVGCDPEFFLYDTKEKMYVGAHEFIPGSKDKPHKLKCGAVQVDGVAVEFNIEPARDVYEFTSNIETVLIQIREMVPKRYDFRFDPYVEFDVEYFKDVPDNFKVLGCDPDFDAFKEGEIININEKAVPPNARTGGGHVHIGWGEGFDIRDPSHLFDCVNVSKNFSQYMRRFKDIRPDTRREKLYGASGSFRPKPYGVECRELSNRWAQYSEGWFSVYAAVYSLIENLVYTGRCNYSYVLRYGHWRKWDG